MDAGKNASKDSNSIAEAGKTDSCRQILETQAERIGQAWFARGKAGAAEVLREVMPGWLPIETAPRDGTRFLGLTAFGVEMVKWHQAADHVAYLKSGWIGTEQDSSCLPPGYRREKAQHQPTHFMPLPHAQKGEG